MGDRVAREFDGVFLTKQKKINNKKGDLFHIMKCSDQSFKGFGEAYFTTVNFKETKGWKKHLRMTLNLVVPVGEVSFFIKKDTNNEYIEYRLSPKNYYRLTVAEGYWVAFTGRSSGLNLVLNLASVEHDPSESINVDLDSFPVDIV